MHALRILDASFRYFSTGNVFCRVDKWGRTALHLAAACNHVEGLDLLLGEVKTQEIRFMMGIEAGGGVGATVQPSPTVMPTGLVASEEAMLPRFLNARDEYGQ